MQEELTLCYSDGMGFESKPTFCVDRVSFHNYLIMYTISGRLWCHQNCENIAVDPGESILLDLHCPHKYYFEKEIPSRIAWVHINGSAAAQVMQNIQKIQELPIKRTIPEIYDLIMELFELSDRSDQDIFQQSQLCYRLLLEFMRAVWMQDMRDKKKIESQQEIYFKNTMWHYISRNLHRDVTVEELAKQVSLSKYHFIRTFQESFDATPIQFITAEKIRRARYQLLNTGEGIAQIAEELGFTTPGYFTKVFKKVVGVSPRQYRESGLE